jgi:hypothetical protein
MSSPKREVLRHVNLDTDALGSCNLDKAEGHKDLFEAADSAAHRGSAPFPNGPEGTAVVLCAGVGDGFHPALAGYEDLFGWGRRIAPVSIEFVPHPVLGR